VSTLLELAAPRAARWLALRFLDEARAARERLDDASESEALHDFRVALRRLRSTLRAYAEHLEGGVGGKDRRRFKTLARATGDSRDGEVMIGWMEARRGDLSEAEGAGLDWLLGRLRARQEKLDHVLRDEVAHDFERACTRLGARLAWYATHVTVESPAEGPPLGPAVAERVAEHAEALRSALATVRSLDDQERAHEARIHAKRLRYLLEPFADEREDARALVKQLKKLQDVLGEMHDAHGAGGLLAAERAKAEAKDPLPEPDVLPGLDALAATARAETERRFAQAEGEWLGDAAAGFFARVDALAAELRGGGDREIERKFLLRDMPPLPRDAVRTEIVQGYLPGDRLQERVRRVRRTGEPPRYFRTVKLGTGLSRTEVEEEADEATFRRLWPLTKGRRVQKLRFRVAVRELTWEIDRFRGRRLVLAEVELPSEDHAVPIPYWLRDYVVRDVTGEDEYVNINLAR
jgi:CHAD domain-containing protein/CYTH domain-containing protein